MSTSPYAPAAKLLNQIWTSPRKGLKTVAYHRTGELVCSKSTYAQCANVLKHKPLLDRILVKLSIEAKNKGLLYVLLYELLLGPNLAIRGGGALPRTLRKKEQELKDALATIREGEGRGNPDSQPPAAPSTTIPRYVRVNTLKTTTAQVVQILKDKGMDPNHIFLDPHIPDVLVLPPTPETRALLQDLVTAHEILLQDKASCFSAFCLVHGFSGDTDPEEEIEMAYLDACAAPGNKTSHLAALLVQQQQQQQQQLQQQPGGSTRKIHALDKSPDRYKLLQRRMNELVGSSSSSSTTLTCHNLDFFQVCSIPKNDTNNNTFKDKHHNFDTVRAILLDPSCSGSGMTGNHLEAAREHGGDPGFCNDRIQSLAEFQLQALRHATSSVAFPLVTRVVYSTCSLYLEENEKVVQRFLQSQTKGSQDDTNGDGVCCWKLVPPACLTGWKRRGLPVEGLSKEETDAMIRVHPDHDASNGFFVACFEKQQQQQQLAMDPSPKDKLKKKKRKSSSGSNINGNLVRVDNSSTNIPLYNNEFHHAEPFRSKESMETEKVSQIGESSKGKSPSAGKRKLQTVEGPSSLGDNKRNKKIVDAAATTKDNSKVEETKHATKRAKKLEWKRKQRERKSARLEGKERIAGVKVDLSTP